MIFQIKRKGRLSFEDVKIHKAEIKTYKENL